MNNKEVLKELTETKDFLTKSQEFTKDTRLRLRIAALDIAISAIEKVDKLEKIIAQYNPLYEKDFLAMVNLMAKSVLALEIDLKTGKKED